VRVEDLCPTDAVALDAATTGSFFSVLSEMLDDDLAVYVHVERRQPHYALLLLGLQGELVVIEHELPVAWSSLGERQRLRLLRLYLDGLAQGHERWRRAANVRLRRLGVGEIPPT
jgi:hypothetical protein